MKLLELSYRNIISYGNVLQTFTFTDEPRLVLVQGENGAGKSSIKEALTVAIYGKSAIRAMKDIPNWINKNAYTNIKFITNSGETVQIERGIAPNFSSITVDGAPFNLPDKRKVDEFVEDDLARIPFSVFSNTISLSFDDFKSFINLNRTDKEKIVDKIFGIDILSNMRTVVKQDLRDNKKELELINAQIVKDRSTLLQSTNQLIELKEKLSNRKDKEQAELETKISEKKIESETLAETNTTLNQRVTEAREKVTKIRENANTIKRNIQSVDEKLKLYENNTCPHCLNDLTSSASTKTKESIILKKEMFREKIPEIQKIFKEAQAELAIQVENQTTTSKEFYQIEAEIRTLKSDLQKILNNIVTDETESIQNIIDTIRTGVDEKSIEHESKSEEVELYSTLETLLSDSGIKKTLINKIIPTLNSRIAIISERLEFKFSFSFDSNFDPTVHYLGMDVNPSALSSGQRKKMNLIVLLAFIEIIKMKHGRMNVMFLDEIFSSLDKNNVYMAMEILREYANKYKMTIFVVSHETLPEEFFDTKILVKENNNFSEMEIIETVTQK